MREQEPAIADALSLPILKDGVSRAKLMKISDLYRRYADAVDMCEGTSINPSICGVRYGGSPVHNPNFLSNPEGYSFMIAIVENKPVFEGDVLYHKDKGVYTVQKIEKFNDGRLAFKTTKHPLLCAVWVDGDWIENYSWNPPKDEYAELKRAQSKGEKIAWQTGTGVWSIQGYISDELFAQHPVDRWKVVEDDEVEIVHYYKWGDTSIRLTKSGLDGKITAEIVS